MLAHGNKTSFRGLCIKENVIWVSGSGGTVGKSTNGGATWEWHTVAGYEKMSSGILRRWMKKQRS
ncbi:hypothetical protein [Niabella ginsengisoli]|uniref:Oxidoreductase n=1 Tax=Niabella ginsengisoli TaxID=522298 RepID=A0ABS9SJ30_9BACT|nr:hypothetical protein [Niabella ginsengisoli]MCH5598364.1 hypothetical protein [Niabella ginsengisoli]